MFTRAIINTSKNSAVLSSFIRFNTFASTISPEPKTAATDNDIYESPQINKSSNSFKRNRIVEAAFASLTKQTNVREIETPFTDSKLEKATTIDQLLSISEGSGVSRRHALKVVSILSDWSNSGKVQLADFEGDSRFIRLCLILTNSPKIKKKTKTLTTHDDLSMVLSVTADDEAAQLIGNISLSQMVKVMKTLSLKKRRSLLLLRTLAFNITKSPHELNLKEASDLLYSMSTLTFLDENLLTKIANDVCIVLQKKVEKSSVIGSMLTSIGLMKYKNPELLDALSNWILNNHSICRSQDICSLIMTLAVVNFTPTISEKFFETLMPCLLEQKTAKFLVWLEIVWSLVLLNKASAEQVSSILEQIFLINFQENSSLSAKLRLINIDAAAQYLIPDYNGPRLPNSSVIRNVKPAVTKMKLEMTDAVTNTLGNLIQSDQLLRAQVDTGMGFYIDAELLLDKKGCPIPLDQLTVNKDATRVAVMAQDYYDMTLGKVEPTGINVFCENLLKAQGYKILSVPYTDFKPKDNLIQRVKYLENRIKLIVNS